MGRSPCCAKEGLNKGAWTAMEDKTLTDYIKLHGEGHWRGLPKRAGLKRCGKSCRLRWLNYLRPDIKRGNISGDEEELIIRLHKLLGNRWSLIAGRLPGRTDNEIKNYWNSNLSKKLQDRQLHRQQQSDKKGVVKSPIATKIVEAQIPSPNVVIRTKAVKCSTRVLINPPPVPPQPPSPTPPSCNTQVAGPTPRNHNSNMENFALSEGLMEGPLLDFPAMDFSMMGELSFSEFLNSQQMIDICCEFSQGMMNNEGEHLSPSPSSLEEPIVFPEEMMEDWRRSGCGLDASAIGYLLGE